MIHIESEVLLSETPHHYEVVIGEHEVMAILMTDSVQRETTTIGRQGLEGLVSMISRGVISLMVLTLIEASNGLGILRKGSDKSLKEGREIDCKDK